MLLQNLFYLCMHLNLQYINKHIHHFTIHFNVIYYIKIYQQILLKRYIQKNQNHNSLLINLL